MVDFNWITDRLAVGGAITTLDDIKLLESQGVTDIINCANGAMDASLLKNMAEIHFIDLGVDDDGQPKPVDWFDKGIKFGLTALAVPHRKVYTHCMAGVNRGPSMGIAILYALGLNRNDAETIMRRQRPVVNISYKTDAWKAVQSLGYIDAEEGSVFGQIER